jgi:TolB-like protein/DNA-binding winged helix-turn-helix (wHTH) protein
MLRASMSTVGSPPSVRTYSFGTYELDRTGELRKFGTHIRLQNKPFLLLLALVERPGEMITRAELQKRLWPDTFVNFDESLNIAVKKVRIALCDNPDSPAFVETVPGQGYRFIASVGWLGEDLRVTVPDTIRFNSHPPPRWRRRSVAAVAAALAVITAAIALLMPSPSPRVFHSLAVLPFENLSVDQGQDYFVDGVTDELITDVARGSELRITSRTSIMQYKNIHRPMREIARELGVDAVLEGSVRRDGNHVHITAQLIDARTDTHVWAGSYDADSSDIGPVQNELAQTVIRKTGVAVRAISRPRKPINPEARDAYLLGRFYLSSGDIAKGRESFQKAIALQPDYAQAWSGLSTSYGAEGVIGTAPPAEVRAQQEAAARKALELDDSLAEAHKDMAVFYYFYKWDWPNAERESARAVELNPSYAEGHHIRGYVMQTLNRRDEAMREEKTAFELDPSRLSSIFTALIRAHQFDAAVKDAQMRVESHSDYANLHAGLAACYWLNGMDKEAAKELEIALRLNGNKDAALKVHRAFERGGYPAVLELQLSEAKDQAKSRYVPPMKFANLYADLKEKDQTLHYLEAAYEARSPSLVHLQSNPHLEFVHSEPRYRAIVEKLHMPPAY